MTADELANLRHERLVEQLKYQLKTNRGIKIDIEHVDDVEAFRRAARSAARQLGIPVRTGVARDGQSVWAFEGP